MRPAGTFADIQSLRLGRSDSVCLRDQFLVRPRPVNIIASRFPVHLIAFVVRTPGNPMSSSVTLIR